MIGQAISHYRILQKIGAGGMGEVYRAHDERLDREVALKVLPAGTLADETARKRFRKEALLLAKLNHPNIETVYDFDTQNGVDFLAMELIPGTPLNQRLAAGPLSEKEIARLGVQLAQGLAAAHARGVIHRDVKPGNLMIGPEGHLKILDFGLARFLRRADSADVEESVTESQTFAGTLPYMAPEQLRGETADERSDIYAAGAALYEMATEQRPFTETHQPRLTDAILHGNPPLPRQLNPRVSPQLESIILKALDKDPERRYQSAKELRIDLERLRSPMDTPEPSLPLDQSQVLALEMAHVLFMDIVGYSKLPMDQQQKVLRQLQRLVRANAEVARAQANDELLKLPTGDGMALVFFGDPEAPARCALELNRALRNQMEIALRMGVHTGPVYRLADINANRNVAGGGINLTQRVMDCGDAGHILVSKSFADVLGQLSNWAGALHDLGEVEVKHGAHVYLFNLYTADAGNPDVPAKLRRATTSQTRARKAKRAAAIVAAGAVVAIGGWFFQTHRVHALSETDTVVLADFANSTDDAVFDDTLKKALSVGLMQSPFLNIVSDQKMNDTLRMMGRSPGDRVNAETAREVCQRAGSKAFLAGSIASLGSEYVLGLSAVNCRTGDTLAQEQVQARKKEDVLKALDQAARKLREKLGESLSSIQKFDTPISQATTPSFEALKAYSLAGKAQSERGDAGSIPFMKRAIALDPNFAMAYAGAGVAYSNLGETGLGSEYLQKAYELRDRVSEREKFQISAFYYDMVTGELPKAIQAYELWAQEYPRDASAHDNLGSSYWALGQYEKALPETLQASRLKPDGVYYSNLISEYAALNRLDEANATYQQALARKQDNAQVRGNQYGVAFLEGDVAEMERQLVWAAGKPGVEDSFLNLQSNTEAYYGRLDKARELSRRAVESARRNDENEIAALWHMDAALQEAEFGNLTSARQETAAALALASSRDVLILAALARAWAGDSAWPQKTTDDLEKRFRLNTMVNGYWLPTIRAAIEINRNNPSKAIELLHAASPYELGNPPPAVGGLLHPIYLRGQAYLLLRRGSEAAGEFQKILDHRGVVMNCPLGALAHLGLARAYVLQGDTVKARAAYQDFLRLWKDADPDIPVLKQAKAEYAKLK